jgi:phage baseplate assembly protein W
MSRSAREIDLDSRTYVGLSFPLRADTNNSFTMTKNSIQQSRHNLRNLLLTYPGERVHNLEFGCKLREVCFEQQDENLPTKIQNAISDAVTKFLPYINILDIATQSDTAQSEKVYVTLKFSTTLDPQINQSLTLDATEATEVDSAGASDTGRGGP